MRVRVTRARFCLWRNRLLIHRELRPWPEEMLLSSFGLPASAGLRQTQNVGASLFLKVGIRDVCPVRRMRATLIREVGRIFFYDRNWGRK